jgi:hypothetical protein
VDYALRKGINDTSKLKQPLLFDILDLLPLPLEVLLPTRASGPAKHWSLTLFCGVLAGVSAATSLPSAEKEYYALRKGINDTSKLKQPLLFDILDLLPLPLEEYCSTKPRILCQFPALWASLIYFIPYLVHRPDPRSHSSFGTCEGHVQCLLHFSFAFLFCLYLL